MTLQAAELCSRVSVREIYTHLTGWPLSNSGVGLCPFHDDTNPSFSCNETFWYCHAGCGGGNAIHFVERVLSLSFSETLEWLAEYIGGQAEQVRRAAPPPKSTTVRLPASWLARYAPPSAAAIAYYKARGLSDKTIREYRLGWGAPPQSKVTRPRYAIPFLDRDGVLRTYRFRRNDADTQDTGPKYLSMTGVPTYLFGLHRLAATDWCILCGSQMDAMLLTEWGLPAIAGAGEGIFKKEWASELKACGLSTVFTLYDHDEGGWKGAARVAQVCADTGPRIVTVRWPAQSPAKFDVGAAYEAGWRRDDILRLIAGPFGK